MDTKTNYSFGDGAGWDAYDMYENNKDRWQLFADSDFNFEREKERIMNEFRTKWEYTVKESLCVPLK